MNTPGHAVVNLLILGKRDRRSLFAPVAFGAILPDLPLFVFYAYEKGWLKTPERVIWAESYNDLGWQAFFDIFNSLPLLAAWRALPKPLSMMLHGQLSIAKTRTDICFHSRIGAQSPALLGPPGGIVTTIESRWSGEPPRILA